MWIDWREIIYKCHCPECGKEADVDGSMILTSVPPQYNYTCPHCGKVGSIYTSECWTTYAEPTPIVPSKPVSEEDDITLDMNKKE